MQTHDNNEPIQTPQTQHILGDDRSKAWVEVKDPSANLPALTFTGVSWFFFSALVFKLVRHLASFMPLLNLALGVFLLLVLPLAFVSHRLWSENKKLTLKLFVGLTILGVVIGGI